MIEEDVEINDDPKYKMKYELKKHLLEKINVFESNGNVNKIKAGRPKSDLSISVTIDAIFLRSG